MNLLNASQRMKQRFREKYGKGCPQKGQDDNGWYSKLLNAWYITALKSGHWLHYSDHRTWRSRHNNRLLKHTPNCKWKALSMIAPGFLAHPPRSSGTCMTPAGSKWVPAPWPVVTAGQRSCSRPTASDPSAHTWCTTRGEEARCWACWGAGSRGEGRKTATGSSTTSALYQCVCQALRSIMPFQWPSLWKTLGESWLDKKGSMVHCSIRTPCCWGLPVGILKMIHFVLN